MRYLYAPDVSHEDLASGRVLHGGPGVPNFPVRLLCEMFERGISYLGDDVHDLCVYDPCCGGGYLLTVLGLCYGERVQKVCGSDIDERMVQLARKNLSLLTADGLDARCVELERLIEQYGKDAHRDALASARRLKAQLGHDIEHEAFVADCTGELPFLHPHIVITDVPYGNLVSWQATGDPLDQMMRSLAASCDSGTLAIIAMGKRQRLACERWERLERTTVGKRAFGIWRLA